MWWQYNAIQFVWIITVRNPLPRQTPPYRLQKPLPTTAADGMHPTGMHSCLFKNWKFLDFGDILVVNFFRLTTETNRVLLSFFCNIFCNFQPKNKWTVINSFVWIFVWQMAAKGGHLNFMSLLFPFCFQLGKLSIRFLYFRLLMAWLPLLGTLRRWWIPFQLNWSLSSIT